MNSEKQLEAHEPSGAEQPLSERMETLHRQITIRDTRQAELLALMAAPLAVDSALTSAWLQLEIAQGDLDDVIRSELQRHLQN
jgi:hypothetical protein